MQIGILGQGFALYGYLPALMELNYSVHTLARYETYLRSRVELADYIEEISFVESEPELIMSSQSLVIAKKPSQQFDIIENLDSRYTNVFLEKPLAPSLIEHRRSIELLSENKVNFSVGYIFYLTDWFVRMHDLMNRDRVDFRIKWEIPKPPISWKCMSEEGGGLGSFYAIHFVQVLKLLEFEYSIMVSPVQDAIRFMGSSRNDSSIYIDVRFGLLDYFEVATLKSGSLDQIIYSGTGPVGPRSSRGMRDSRVDLLKSYILDTALQETHSNSLSTEEAALEFRYMLEKGAYEARQGL